MTKNFFLCLKELIFVVFAFYSVLLNEIFFHFLFGKYIAYH